DAAAGGASFGAQRPIVIDPVVQRARHRVVVVGAEGVRLRPAVVDFEPKTLTDLHRGRITRQVLVVVGGANAKLHCISEQGVESERLYTAAQRRRGSATEQLVELAEGRA